MAAARTFAVNDLDLCETIRSWPLCEGEGITLAAHC